MGHSLAKESIIRGLTPAWILVDDAIDPSSALTWFKGRVFLSGDPDDRAFREAAAGVLSDPYGDEIVAHGGAQEALDAPRFCILGGTSGGKVALEEGISVKAMNGLASMGHDMAPRTGHSLGVFGKGQIILRDPETGVLCTGSDPRADGMAIGW